MPLSGERLPVEGSELAFTLAPVGEGEPPLRVAYNLRDDYRPGRAFKDNDLLAHDLVFQYGCRSPWMSLLAEHAQ